MMQIEKIRSEWERLKTEHKGLRPLFNADAAAQIGISEVELVASVCDGECIIRLKSTMPEIIGRFTELGQVMALTRNSYAVLEKTGNYPSLRLMRQVGQAIGPEIDMRFYLENWASAWALVDESKGGFKTSLQFFDPHGRAVHKVFLSKDGDKDAFFALRDAFKASDQSPGQSVEPVPKVQLLNDSEIDIVGLQNAWENLVDTHDFAPMLARFRVTRLQALRHGPPQLRERLNLKSVETMLISLAQSAVPFMIFVGSTGAHQIHSGPVKRVVTMGSWLNVMDPKTNLHLNMEGVASAWLVRKPTQNGPVQSVELFDEKGQEVALFFGLRKGNQPEDKRWQDLIGNLPKWE